MRLPGEVERNMSVLASFDVRPAQVSDLDNCLALDPTYSTEWVWQMDTRGEDGQVNVAFRAVRLPRAMRVAYPRDARQRARHWHDCAGLLVAEQARQVAGYVAWTTQDDQGLARLTDLVVGPQHRQQGIGAALVKATAEWSRQRGLARLMAEFQTKNYPAICFYQKLGFVFCGFNDHYYANQDIALFFVLGLR